MIKLSRRLEAVARLVTSGNRVCDVGTDHAYIPIYLLQTGSSEAALAMDVNEGPLKRAREHIEENGLCDYIETRRSDGLRAMETGECDSIVIAGMGGGLMIRILEDSYTKLGAVKELILQPQSDIEQVRRFVGLHGFVIDRQDMVKEDGKYYMMFRCIHRGKSAVHRLEKNREADFEFVQQEFLQTAFDRYGEQLLKENHPVLQEYLEREEHLIREIQESLGNQKDSAAAERRLHELKERQQVLEVAQAVMNGNKKQTVGSGAKEEQQVKAGGMDEM